MNVPCVTLLQRCVAVLPDNFVCLEIMACSHVEAYDAAHSLSLNGMPALASPTEMFRSDHDIAA